MNCLQGVHTCHSPIPNKQNFNNNAPPLAEILQLSYLLPVHCGKCVYCVQYDISTGEKIKCTQ